MNPNPAPVKTDADLLRAFRRDRDECAFGALIARHGAMILALSERRLDQPDAAPDVVVRTFALLARRADRAPETGLAGWLAQVAIHLCDTENRAGRRRRAREANAHLAALRDRPSMTRQSLDLSCRLQGLILKLRPGERECLLLHAAEGLTFREVGERQGITEDAARMRTKRAIERVRRRLGLSPAEVASALAAIQIVPFSSTRSAQIARTALTVPPGMLGAASGGLALGWTLMTNTQRLSLALTALILLPVAGLGGAYALRGPHRPALSAPMSPLTKPDLAAFVGAWRGTLTYIVRRTGRRVTMRTDVALTPLADGLRIKVGYDDPAWKVDATLRFPAAGKTFVYEDKGERKSYRLIEVGAKRISGERFVDEAGRPADERLSLVRDGETLSVLIEERLKSGGGWKFANEHRLERAR